MLLCSILFKKVSFPLLLKNCDATQFYGGNDLNCFLGINASKIITLEKSSEDIT